MLARPSLILAAVLLTASPAAAKPKLYVSFQWHMHQPIYWPYEPVTQTQDAGRWGFDLMSIFHGRTGPYTAWPMDAVGQGLSLPHLGAQVSFTGSLIENLDAIEAAGRGFSGWRSRWAQSRSMATSLGNPRLDLTMIGYHHPLMPLVPAADRKLQLELHKRALERAFGAPSKPARGVFPPETAFAAWIVPELAAAGAQWALVDNIHFDRARPDYPYTPSANLIPPNPADQRNAGGSAHWVQLQNLWAPSKVSAPWGYQPHWVEYRDPETGAASRIIAVPAARYEGNEDARGGYGAFLYEKVFEQYEAFNTDDAHPMLVVLHHDGDNYGGGTDSYYHGNFAAFVSWLQANPDRFEATTIQDYLDRFPPAQDDVIHVEPGSWSGADNGDPQFLKWNGKPAADGYSPDRNSWAALTAAANRVHTAQALRPYGSLDAIVAGTGSDTEKAWHFLLNAETSCYWYWDNSEGGKWDSHPTRAANLAVEQADKVLALGGDPVPPTLFLPQREPYNPGGIEWGNTPQPSDFDVFTFAYDVSGMGAVTLHVRVTPKGQVEAANERYAGGSWQAIPMQKIQRASRTDPQPKYQADEYRAKVVGVSDALVDYYVSAQDGSGNLAKSPIQHVYVGLAQGPGPGPDAKVGWSPSSPTVADLLTVWAPKAGKLHWGVDGWKLPPESAWPAGTVAFGDGKSVESPLSGPDAQGRYSVQLGPFAGTGVRVIDFVMHYADGSWENNAGGDWHVALAEAVDGGTVVQPGPDAGTAPLGGPDAGTSGTPWNEWPEGEESSGDEPAGGCGCGTAGGPAGMALAALSGAAAAIRRRRRAS